MKGCKEFKIKKVNVFVDGKKVNKTNTPSVGENVVVEIISEYTDIFDELYTITATGRSILSKEDTFDYNIGFDIAYNRAVISMISAAKEQEQANLESVVSKFNHQYNKLNAITNSSRLIVTALTSEEF